MDSNIPKSSLSYERLSYLASGFFFLTSLLCISTNLVASGAGTCGHSEVEQLVKKDLALPRDINPEDYQLKLSIGAVGNTYQGLVEILLSVKPWVTTSYVILHAAPDLELDETRLWDLTIPQPHGAANQEIPIRCLHREPANELLIIFLESPIKLTQNMLLSISFRGPIRSEIKGLFRHELDDILLTRLEPRYSRYLMPSFDESTFKATFKLTVELDHHLNVLTNTNLESPEEALITGRKLSRFERTGSKISPHELTIAIGRFKKIYPNAQVHQTILRFWVPVNRIGRPKLDLLAPVKIISSISEYFHLEYPSKKLDFLTLSPLSEVLTNQYDNTEPKPQFDNLGLAILFETKSKSVMKARSLAVASLLKSLIRHIFKTIVSVDLPQDYWFFNAFSGWLTFTGVEGILSEYLHHAYIFENENRRAMDYYSNRDAEQILDSSLAYRLVEGSEASKHGYWKSVAIFRNLVFMCNDKNFRNIFRQLAHEYTSGRHETAHNLLLRIKSHCNLNDLDRALIRWFSQPGIPLLHVTKRGGRELAISQEIITTTSNIQQQPAAEPTSAPKASNLVIGLPMTFIKANSRANLMRIKRIGQNEEDREDFALVREQFDLDDPQNCVKFNKNGYGFYRVHYSDELITNLQSGCPVDNLSLLDRVNLIEDALALFKAAQVGAYYLIEFLKIPHDLSDGELLLIMHEAYEKLARVFLDHQEFERPIRAFGIHLFSHLDVSSFFLQPNERLQSSVEARARWLVVDLLLKLEHEPTIELALETLERYRNNLDARDVSPRVRQSILLALAKRNQSARLMSDEFEHWSLAFIANALGSVNNKQTLTESWDWIKTKANYRASYIKLNFLEAALTTSAGRSFLSDYIRSESTMHDLVALIGRERTQEFISEYCESVHGEQSQDICSPDEPAEGSENSFDAERWPRSEQELHRELTKLHSLDIEKLRRTLSPFYPPESE